MFCRGSIHFMFCRGLQCPFTKDSCSLYKYSMCVYWFHFCISFCNGVIMYHVKVGRRPYGISKKNFKLIFDIFRRSVSCHMYDITMYLIGLKRRRLVFLTNYRTCNVALIWFHFKWYEGCRSNFVFNIVVGQEKPPIYNWPLHVVK